MILRAEQLHKIAEFLTGLDGLTELTGVIALAAGGEYIEIDGDLIKVRVIRRNTVVDTIDGAQAKEVVTYVVDTSD